MRDIRIRVQVIDAHLAFDAVIHLRHQTGHAVDDMAAGDRVAVRADDHAAAHAEQLAARIIRGELKHRGHAGFKHLLLRHGGLRVAAGQRELLAQVGIGHARDDRRCLAAADGRVRTKAAGVIRAGQHARAVQRIDCIRIGSAHGHIRDRALGHGIDRAERVRRQRGRQHRGEHRARRGLIVIRARRLQDEVVQRVIHIGLVPRRGRGKVRAPGMIDAVQAGRQLDGLRHGQRAVRREARVRLAVDQAVFVGGAHVFLVPCVRRHVGKLAGCVHRLRLEIFIARKGGRHHAGQQHSRQQQAAYSSFHWSFLRF